MIIENHIKNITRELQISTNASTAVSRQQQTPKDNSGDSTRKPIAAQSSETNGGTRVKPLPVQYSIDVHKAVEKLNQMMRSQQTDVSFSVDEDAQATVIKIFKTETGELIKQFPPDEILAMLSRFRKMVGLFVDSKV